MMWIYLVILSIRPGAPRETDPVAVVEYLKQFGASSHNKISLFTCFIKIQGTTMNKKDSLVLFILFHMYFTMQTQFINLLCLLQSLIHRKPHFLRKNCHLEIL